MSETNVIVREATPIDLLNIAIEKGAELDKLEKLMELKMRWEADQGRKAFFLALAAFKAEKFTVLKDKTNAQYKTKYSSEDSLLNTINPLLSKHGLSASFDFEQSEGIKVTCFLTHSSGYRESVSLKGNPDNSGSKNPLQQIKSTITYLRKATFEAITGIASSDELGDDDGNGSQEKKCISEDQQKQLSDMIAEKSVDMAKFLSYMNAEAMDKILEKDMLKAVTSLKSAKGGKK